MSKKKLVFRVGTGLAATSMALAIGTGCPKESPVIVNSVPVEENLPPQPATNAAPTPATNTTGTNNGSTNNTNGSKTTGEALPEKAPDIRVNTIPDQKPE